MSEHRPQRCFMSSIRVLDRDRMLQASAEAPCLHQRVVLLVWQLQALASVGSTAHVPGTQPHILSMRQQLVARAFGLTTSFAHAVPVAKTPRNRQQIHVVLHRLPFFTAQLSATHRLTETPRPLISSRLIIYSKQHHHHSAYQESAHIAALLTTLSRVAQPSANHAGMLK